MRCCMEILKQDEQRGRPSARWLPDLFLFSFLALRVLRKKKKLVANMLKIRVHMKMQRAGSSF